MGIERREFLKLAVAGVSSAAGIALLSSCSKSTSDRTLQGTHLAECADISFDQSVDVLIVGSGAAGLAAAMDPSKAGFSVLIAEKSTLLGGESFDATGILRVDGTDIQHKAGISSTAEDAWKSRKARIESTGAVDTQTLELLQKIHMAKTDWVNRIVADYGSQFQDPAQYIGAGVDQDILIPRTGLESMTDILAPIRDKLAQQGTAYRTGLTAVAFILDENGTVCGMRFLASDRATSVDIQAKKIVIATGGFACSQKLMHTHLPGQEHIGCQTFLSDGAMLQACLALNAATADMELETDLTSDIPAASAWGCFGPLIAVDPRGRRFVREDGRFYCPDTCQWQGLGFWWTIFDRNMTEGPQANSVAKTMQKHPDRCVGPCDSVEALAQAMDIDGNALSGTMNAYNAISQVGKDTGFGKDSFLKPLAAPLYAIKQYARRFRTIGGLETNENAQMLDAGKTVIPHVFCCGSVAAGRSEGLADNAGYGLLAGSAIVDELQADAS